MKVALSGFKELEAALMQLDKTATRKATAVRALKRSAEPVAVSMRQKAPRDQGLLAGNIIVSTKIVGEAGNAAYAKARRAKESKAVAVKAMRDARRAAKGTMPPVMMFVGPTTKAYHAHLVEFGTAPHINGGKFAGSKHPGTAPQPFARPAWDATQAEVLARIKDDMAAAIMKAVKSQAKRKAKAAK